MRREWRAVAAVGAVLFLAGVPGAEAEIRTDRLSRRELKAWRRVAAVALATNEGRPLHPTLYGLWRDVESSRHVVHVELRRPGGSSAIAGRFRIETLGPDGRLEAMLILNLKVVDRVLTGSPDAQLVAFQTSGRVGRLAQVLGHELAHAAWAFATPEQARLAFDVQANADRLALQARTVGPSAPGFGEQAEANERLNRLLEEPALMAEKAIAAELARSSHR
jgi:hypothetical protein